MKKPIIFLALLVLISSCTPKLSKEQSIQLKKAYSEKNFFKLEKLMSAISFNKKNPELVFYRASLLCAFNKPIESNELTTLLLNEYKENFNDTLLKDLYAMRAANAYRLQDYDNALRDDSILIANYKHVCDSSEFDDHFDDLSVFKSLKSSPKMEITIPETYSIALKRDMAGLQNVRVNTLTDSMDFVFDTGAAFSVMMESVAKKLGAKILDGEVTTGTSTSKKVSGRMGLLDIKLGKIVLKNVAFIVLPDSLLTFANGVYKIHGIIGFPVMYALKRVSLKENELICESKASIENTNKNFALDGQYLILQVISNNDSLPFLFDSGNQETHLSSRFFNAHKNEIVEKYKKEKVVTGGAGGMEQTEAFIIDSLAMKVGNSHATLDSIRVYPNDLSGYDMKFVYGNFGQDYIGKFSEMTIDFDAMQLSFKGKKK